MSGQIAISGLGTQFLILLWIGVAAVGHARGAPDAPPGEQPNQIRLASLNVHYVIPGATNPVMQWEPRSHSVIAALREIDADVVAFQEMETFGGSHFNEENLQARDVLAAFPDFGLAATGDPSVFPNTQPVLYRRTFGEPVEQGFFFFGPEPDRIYSRPWIGRFPAFATWVRFARSESESHVLVVNVHIDRSSYRNQVRSARLLAERVQILRRPSDSVVVLGDFNSFRWMMPLRVVRRATGLSTAPGNGATFHFYRGLNLFPAIDHVLVDPSARVHATWTYRCAIDGVWPSDHYPVGVDVEFLR